MAGEVARLLALWGKKRKRWKEAEGTHEEGSSHEGPSWNGQSLPEAHGLTQGRGHSLGSLARQGTTQQG